MSPIARLARWFDDRLALAAGTRRSLRKVFPTHWTFLLGEVALFSLVVLVATGVFLALFYTADARPVTYQGPYEPLQGTQVSAAFDSVMRLSFEVRAGLLMRQIHHWAALVFVAAIVVHLLRVFFTGAFRRPREINWVLGVVLLMLSFGAGFTGYSLPDDLLSGTGLRIGYSVLLSIPFAGPFVAFLGLGGEYPGVGALGRLHLFHVLLIPGLLLALVGVHLLVVWRQKHTQRRGPGRTETNVVGTPLYPEQLMVSAALFCAVVAVLALLGGLFEVNPVWLYGPYEPFSAFAPAQPDWYMGWLEGLLRLWPAWEWTVLGITIPEPFLPGVVVPGLIFTTVAAWPWIETRFISRDRDEHHLLDRARDAPTRTAVGVGGLTFLLVIFVAGSNDVLAAVFDVSLDVITNLLRVSALVLPPLAGWLAYRATARLANPAPA